MPGSERGKLLAKLADLVEQHGDELAALEALNVGQYDTLSVGWSTLMPVYSGKPFHMAKMVDIMTITVQSLRYYAGWADKIQGKTIEVSSIRVG